MLMEITFTSRKLDSYKPRSIGARLIPLDRLVDENLVVDENYVAGKLGSIWLF